MTMTPSCDAVALRADLSPADVVVDPVVLFMAHELFPMMTAFWPASANQLDSNARGTAQAWALLIKGFPVSRVREAVLLLAEDPDRQFAPRPAEVKAAILQRNPVPRSAPSVRQISMRACELMAEARVFVRSGTVSPTALAAELTLVMGEMGRLGVVINGRAM